MMKRTLLLLGLNARKTNTTSTLAFTSVLRFGQPNRQESTLRLTQQQSVLSNSISMLSSLEMLPVSPELHATVTQLLNKAVNNVLGAELEVYKAWLLKSKECLASSQLKQASEYLEQIITGAYILRTQAPELLADAYTYKGVILMKGTSKERIEAEQTFNSVLLMWPGHKLALDKLKVCESSRFATSDSSISFEDSSDFVGGTTPPNTACNKP